MLTNLKEDCNVIEMFPRNKRDFSAMIPQSILPNTEKELNEALSNIPTTCIKYLACGILPL